MEVSYVAYDSLGVKSMCTRVETKDCSIIIDPGIAVEEDSFPLPINIRMDLCEEYERKIRESMETSDVVIITHYHYDHHMPDDNLGLYEGKVLIIKDPENFINKSQRERASSFLERVKGLPKEVKIADGREIALSGTKIKFSQPLWHGVKGTNLGYVVMVEVYEGGEKLLYTSDVDGPVLEDPVNYIIRSQPDVLIVDGPPTYLLGYIMAYYNLAKSIINIINILHECAANPIILDHHLARDYRYLDLMATIYEEAEKLGKRICTAAELIGRETKVLEGYRTYGPTKWKAWKKFTKLDVKTVLGNAVKNKLIEDKWLKALEKY